MMSDGGVDEPILWHTGTASMPLSATSLPGVPDDDRLMVGFWMTATEGKGNKAPIRIFITYEALAQLGRSRIRKLDDAINVFDANRAAIEAAAARKFEAKGVEDRTYQGQPIVTLYANDMPDL